MQQLDVNHGLMSDRWQEETRRKKDGTSIDSWPSAAPSIRSWFRGSSERRSSTDASKLRAPNATQAEHGPADCADGRRASGALGKRFFINAQSETAVRRNRGPLIKISTQRTHYMFLSNMFAALNLLRSRRSKAAVLS